MLLKWIFISIFLIGKKSKSKLYLIETVDEEDDSAVSNGYNLDQLANIIINKNQENNTDFDSGDFSLDQLTNIIINKTEENNREELTDLPNEVKKSKGEVNKTKEEVKKILTTTIALTLLITPEGEEPQIKGDIHLPICVSKSIEEWRKKEGYKEIKKEECDDGKGNEGATKNVNVKPYVLPEVKIKLWDILDAKLRDPKQPWSKYKRDDHPCTFKKDFQNACDALQKEMEASTLDEFIGMVGFIKDHKHINKKVYETALIRTLLSRNDTSHDIISPFELNEVSFIIGENKSGNDYDAWKTGDELKNLIVPKDLNPFEPNDPEQNMNYWREDILLHVFHEFWHTVNGYAYPTNRSGEIFTFMHNEFLKRYGIEREINGLSALSCETGEEYFKPFPGQYQPQMFNTDYAKRKKDCQLREQSIQELKYELDSLLRDHLEGDGESFARELDDFYHGYGHVFNAEDCAENGKTVMWAPDASARDPTFFQWHCEIQRVWQLWMDTQPNYKKQDLVGDIEVTKLWVETEGEPQNNLMTYMEEAILNHRDQYTIKYHRQNHKKFDIKFTLKNSQKKQKRVIIRIFLGLSRKGETDDAAFHISKKMIQMDRFVVDLNGDEYQEETRESIESALTMKESGMSLREMTTKLMEFQEYAEPFCGWPSHMYLPRGGKGGRAYKLAIVVSDVDQDVTEGKDGINHILCGHNNPDAVLDKRPFAFPFDRPWDFKLSDVKGIVMFQEIMIHHSDEEIKESCDTENGESCRFPFHHGGISYTGCIDVDDFRPWCSTQKSRWGYCNDHCPLAGLKKT